MVVFLFLKQIIDMLYQFKILDYCLVLLGIYLLFKKLIKKKLTWKAGDSADILIVILAVLFTLSWLRFPAGYQTYFKILSCFMVYFLGRLYKDEIKVTPYVFVTSSYIVVYANFIHRLFRQGFRLFAEASNSGEFYYYKTDLAVGILTAMIFIYLYGNKNVWRFVTLWLVCPYMVLYSGARIFWAVLAVILFVFILCYWEKKTGNIVKIGWRFWGGIIGMAVLGVAFLVLIPQIPFFRNLGFHFTLDFSQGIFSENIMHSRHIIWKEIMEYFVSLPVGKQIIGLDLVTEYLHNSAALPSHSLYVRIIYAVGYLGSAVFIALAVNMFLRLRKVKDREIFYLVMAFGILFFMEGISAPSIDYTQMSWFPMMVCGMLVTATKEEKEAENG